MLHNYTAIDLETTGLNPKRDRIIEAGAIKVRNGIITDRFESLINPRRPLTAQITALTGLCDEDLAHAPEESDIWPDLITFIGTDVLIGHNLQFDYSFLKRGAVCRDLSFEKQGIDTLILARQLLPDLESKSLPFLCRHFGIPHHAHRALPDAEATATLYEKLTFLYTEAIDFIPHRLIYHIKKEPPATKAQKEQLYNLAVRHKLMLDTETIKAEAVPMYGFIKIAELTRNEASRITDRILSTYGR